MTGKSQSLLHTSKRVYPCMVLAKEKESAENGVAAVHLDSAPRRSIVERIGWLSFNTFGEECGGAAGGAKCTLLSKTPRPTLRFFQ